MPARERAGLHVLVEAGSAPAGRLMQPGPLLAAELARRSVELARRSGVGATWGGTRGPAATTQHTRTDRQLTQLRGAARMRIVAPTCMQHACMCVCYCVRDSACMPKHPHPDLLDGTRMPQRLREPQVGTPARAPRCVGHGSDMMHDNPCTCLHAWPWAGSRVCMHFRQAWRRLVAPKDLLHCMQSGPVAMRSARPT